MERPVRLFNQARNGALHHYALSAHYRCTTSPVVPCGAKFRGVVHHGNQVVLCGICFVVNHLHHWAPCAAQPPPLSCTAPCLDLDGQQTAIDRVCPTDLSVDLQDPKVYPSNSSPGKRNDQYPQLSARFMLGTIRRPWKLTGAERAIWDFYHNKLKPHSPRFQNRGYYVRCVGDSLLSKTTAHGATKPPKLELLCREQTLKPQNPSRRRKTASASPEKHRTAQKDVERKRKTGCDLLKEKTKNAKQ